MSNEGAFVTIKETIQFAPQILKNVHFFSLTRAASTQANGFQIIIVLARKSAYGKLECHIELREVKRGSAVCLLYLMPLEAKQCLMRTIDCFSLLVNNVANSLEYKLPWAKQPVCILATCSL